MLDKKRLGFKIKYYRMSEAGDTQKTFSDKLGVSLELLNKWEKGILKPNEIQVRKIARLTNSTYADFKKMTEEEEALYNASENNIIYKKELARFEFRLLLMEEIEEFANKYIEDNYHDYNYEKYLKDFPKSNLKDFNEHKEKEVEKFSYMLDEMYESAMSDFDTEVYKRTNLKRVNYTLLAKNLDEDELKEENEKIIGNEKFITDFLDTEL